MILGAKHVETPYIEIGQICTFLYFAWFILFIPATSLFEEVISNRGISNKPLYLGNLFRSLVSKPRVNQTNTTLGNRMYSTTSKQLEENKNNGNKFLPAVQYLNMEENKVSIYA
jgi:hypothetical protein